MSDDVRQQILCAWNRSMVPPSAHYFADYVRTRLKRLGISQWRMQVELRLPGETDDEFGTRAERVAQYARVLIDAALANVCVKHYIADKNLPQWTEASQRTLPIVRVEYEQAIAIGSIGETLCATKSKHWGEGPQILPVQPDDPLYVRRITYLFRENSIFNRRYQQRQKLKQLLGNKERKLVGVATRSNLYRIC